MHAELCLLEAFEMEASQMLADMPLLEEDAQPPSSPPPNPASPPPKDAKAAKTQPQQPQPPNSPPALQPATGESEGGRRTRSQTAAAATKTVESSGGIKLMVSVERATDAGLAAEIDSLDEGDLDEDELTALADEDVSLPAPNPSSPSRPRRSGGGPIIAGALANGTEEDLYKPKMECPTCGLVLYRHNFSTHYRIHTGEMPFHCTYCEKRFRTTSALKVHVRAHTGEKPYVCPRCSYACITKRNLDRHIINNHVREGTRRGPRYRRSRYRESDPHHEEYLIQMGQGSASAEAVTEEGWAEMETEERPGAALYQDPPQEQSPGGQQHTIVLTPAPQHEEVSVEIELNPTNDPNVVVVDADLPPSPQGHANAAAANSSDNATPSPRRSGRARLPTSKAT